MKKEKKKEKRNRVYGIKFTPTTFILVPQLELNHKKPQGFSAAVNFPRPPITTTSMRITCGTVGDTR